MEMAVLLGFLFEDSMITLVTISLDQPFILYTGTLPFLVHG